MPVTIKPARHAANIITTERPFVRYPNELLRRENLDKYDRPITIGNILQSSFDGVIPPSLIAEKHGFVYAITAAYCSHHHLVIRPDDVWMAIITQFSAYVNAHAEELRDHFVAHEGQKDLVVRYSSGTRKHTIDFAQFASKIADLMEQNIVDPELREWIVPAFSTTTPNDAVVAKIAMMGTLQAYFSYSSGVWCGIPTVTLLGTKGDYLSIQARLEKLRQYGEEPAEFCSQLEPILGNFVRSFDAPDDEHVIKFWQSVCSENRPSGFEHFTGWITTFCFWDSDGERAREPGKVGMSRIPRGLITVPVRIDDNGEKVEAEMLAGSVGISCTSSGQPSGKGEVGLDTMQPTLGWFIYEKALTKDDGASM